MRASTAAQIMLGATLLVAGFGLLTDGSPTRGPLAQTLTGLFDMEERECQHAQVAVGSSCPAGCAPRPIQSSEALGVARLPQHDLARDLRQGLRADEGYARLTGASLIDSDLLVVTLHAEPDDAFQKKLEAMGVTLASRFDGLYRYDATVAGGDIAKIKKRLSALPEVVSAEFVPR